MVRETPHMSADMATDALFARLKAEFEKLQKSEINVHDKQQAVKKAEHDITSRETAVADRSAILDLKETTTQEIASALAEQEKQLEERDSIISSHEALDSRTAAVGEAEAEVAKDRQRLTRGEELIRVREEEVSERETYVADRGEDQVHRETAITRREIKFAKQEKEKEQELDSLRFEVAQKEDELAEQVEEMIKKDENLHELRMEVNELHNKLAMHKQDMDRKNQELDDSRYEVQQQAKKQEEHGKELEEKKWKIEDLIQLLSRKDETVEYLEGQIDGLKISHENETLVLKQQHDQELEKLRAEVKKEKAYIRQIIGLIDQRDLNIAALERNLKKKDGESTSFEAKIQDKNDQITRLNEEQQETSRDLNTTQSLLSELGFSISPSEDQGARPPYPTISVWPKGITNHLDGHCIYNLGFHGPHNDWRAFMRVPETAVGASLRALFQRRGALVFAPQTTRSYIAEMGDFVAVDEMTGRNVYRLSVTMTETKCDGLCYVPRGRPARA